MPRRNVEGDTVMRREGVDGSTCRARGAKDETLHESNMDPSDRVNKMAHSDGLQVPLQHRTAVALLERRGLLPSATS
jgi:hypothetical protein